MHALFSDQGEKVVNDHIAFRTFNHERMNIEVLVRPFIERGYMAAGHYQFKNKHLHAMHFELPGRANAPRVFISELLLNNFSPWLQEQIHQSIDKVNTDIWKSDELIFSGNVFGVPSYNIYEKLRIESEYAAWLYIHGFRANHFTVSVNSLNGFRGIEDVNKFLKDNGYLMNSKGNLFSGFIAGSADKIFESTDYYRN
ncbi:MAG TPA: DUF1338 domain-containing protein [Bacteroides sp.]|nr:DUF1338 domain-containing protein [Bacteroides sp.]